jgi:Zn-dependent protease
MIETPETPETRKRRTRRWGGIVSGSVIAIGLLLLKLKGVLYLLFTKAKVIFVNPFEGFGIAQMAVSGGSMIVTIAAYAVKMGFAFALGFVLVTVIHEIGHAVMIRAKGLRAGAMVFIPFVGGAVTLKDQPRSAYDDAQIGLAGPIAGTLASFGALMIYEWSGYVLYLAIAFAGFLLNLFNLLPIGPLDGGRVAAAITKWMWLLGGIVLFWVMIAWRSPLLLFVLLLAVYQIYRAIRDEGDRFYSVTLAQRAGVGAVYFALVTILGYQTVVTHAELLSYRL